MSLLDGLISATVRFATLIDPAADLLDLDNFCVSEQLCTPRHLIRGARLVIGGLESMMGHKWATEEQRTGSREASGHRSFCRGVWHESGPGMRVKDDDKGNGASLNGLDPTFVPTKGLLSRELSRIGANGVMVLRMGSALGRDAEHCRLQRRTREKKVGTLVTHRELLLFTLRPTHQAREPSGATRDPRERPPRRPTCPTAEASAPSISRCGKRVKQRGGGWGTLGLAATFHIAIATTIPSPV